MASGFAACRKTTRSRGNPFLPAVAGQKFLPPGGCGSLLLLRPSQRACKRQTAAPAPLRLFRPQDVPQLRSPWGQNLALNRALRRKAARTLSTPNFPVCVPSIRTCQLDGTFFDSLKNPRPAASGFCFGGPFPSALEPKTSRRGTVLAFSLKLKFSTTRSSKT